MGDNRSLIDTAHVVPAAREGNDNFSDTVGTTAIRQIIPESWKGRRVEIKVWGGNVSFLTGDDGVEASYTAEHGGSAPNWTTGDTIAPPIFDGTSDDKYIEKHSSVTHFSIHGSAANIRVWITPSDLADASPTHSHTD